MNDLHICIVDDHCDAFFFVKAACRHNIFQPDRGLHMVHFDAHPDLAAPSCSNMSQIMDDKGLSDVLSGEGGISEFILPMFAHSLVGHVTWIRPKWTEDPHINQGWGVSCSNTYQFLMGTPAQNECGMLGVTCASSYYLDDGCVYSKSELTDTVSISVRADTLEGLTSMPVEHGDAWMLDICLDYFSTENPFMVKIHKAVKLHQPSLDSSRILVLLTDLQGIIRSRRFRLVEGVGGCGGAGAVVDSAVDAQERRSERHRWHDFFRHWMMMEAGDAEGNERGGEEYSMSITGDTPMLELKSLCQKLRKALQYSRPILEMIVESSTLLLLPHHHASQEELTASLTAFETWINTHPHWPPRLVTIAESAEDGYTPTSHVSVLKQGILDILTKRATKGKENLRLRVHDLREDAQNKCIALFACIDGKLSSAAHERKRKLFEEMGILDAK